MGLCHTCGKQYKCSFKNLFADFKTMISNYGKKRLETWMNKKK